MVCCGSLIDRLCGAMRELEAQLAEVRSEVQEGRCRCSQAQFSALQDDAITSSLGQQSLPPVFAVPPTPEETPHPNCPESSAGASQHNLYVRTQQDTPPPPSCQNTEENAPRFKPMNLPKFAPKGNIHTFIRPFKMSIYGANNQ
ncbi:hypothetical protein DSO57_1033903 [Entomophthora muscae]|uniref:Uncharacterized protein n=1 Tax=Entomophthora muscae TaxID=34485 RepID=A0ACC2TYJ4_9FUNG|nr:hypothetical protein DSO57_1033903 [Entomophthora muscae]